MKPLSIVLLCMFSMVPFLVITGVRSDALAAALTLRSHYDAVIDQAISDTAERMAGMATGAVLSDGISLDGTSLNGVVSEDVALDGAVLDGSELDGAVLDGTVLDGEELALAWFLDELCTGFGAVSPQAKARIRMHVPFVVMVEKDHAVLFALLPVKGDNGGEYRHVRLPDVPFTWQCGDGLQAWNFIGEDRVRVIDLNTGEETITAWDCLTINGSPAFPTTGEFRAVRDRVVRDTVGGLLETGMQLTRHTGEAGGFDLPVSGEAAFRNNIEGVGLFAYLEDLPVGTDMVYRTYAFGGGAVVRKTGVTGWLEEDLWHCCKPGCVRLDANLNKLGWTPDLPVPEGIRFFSDVQEAVSHGCLPCPVCRP